MRFKIVNPTAAASDTAARTRFRIMNYGASRCDFSIWNHQPGINFIFEPHYFCYLQAKSQYASFILLLLQQSFAAVKRKMKMLKSIVIDIVFDFYF